jgi:hypothetical protein
MRPSRRQADGHRSPGTTVPVRPVAQRDLGGGERGSHWQITVGRTAPAGRPAPLVDDKSLYARTHTSASSRRRTSGTAAGEGHGEQTDARCRRRACPARPRPVTGGCISNRIVRAGVKVADDGVEAAHRWRVPAYTQYSRPSSSTTAPARGAGRDSVLPHPALDDGRRREQPEHDAHSRAIRPANVDDDDRHPRGRR